MKSKGILALRKKIDNVDSEIIKLLNKRASLSLSIGDNKKKNGREIYDPSRETKVYKNVQKQNKGPLEAGSVRAIYTEIMSSCRSLEEKAKVSFLGPKNTFTHQVAIKKFGSSVDYIACSSIPEIFKSIENSNADFGYALYYFSKSAYKIK